MAKGTAVLWTVAAALTFTVLIALTGTAASGASCDVWLNDQNLAASNARDPIRLTPNGPTNIRWTSTAPVTRATVTLALGPIPVTKDVPVDRRGAARGEGDPDLTQYTAFARGLYEVTVTIDGCALSGWITVGAGSPLDTPVGWMALGAMLTGSIGVLAALLRALRGRGSVRGAFLGGALTGGGFLLFQQQSGISAATTDSLLTWTIGPGAASGAAQFVISAVTRSFARPASMPTTVSTGGAAAPKAAPPPVTLTPPRAPMPSTPAAPSPVDSAPAGGRITIRLEREPAEASATEATIPGVAVGATVPSAAQPELPRTSYARLECPDAIVARTEFELIVGLMDRPDPKVAGGPMRLPDWVVAPTTLTVQIVADGFTLRPGETWRLDLPFSAQTPYPAGLLHLTAEAGSDAVRPGSIRAMYSVGGQPIGLAVRSVAVVRDASLLTGVAPRPPSPSIELSVPEGQVAPDLTVRIERAESQASGRLLMQLLTADPAIPLPDAPMSIDIGGDPAADLRHVINEMNAVEGSPTQYVSLRGIGLTIAEQLPQEFWDVLADVASRVKGRRPTILFLSAEPYVPWELAVVDPPLDADAPPFLSAQANVGRWVLGQRRPKLPPPAAHSFRSVAVVSGRYALPGWTPLEQAEAEATDLVERLGAAKVNAMPADVLHLLRGDPSAEVIHFAVHGNFDAEGMEDGLILVDGTALDPLAVRGTPLNGSPFVFLNACQVARGNQILGDHAGLAEAFLFAGACGVIAPLWSIDDSIARTMAVKFYEGILQGETAAEILRRERAAFRDSPETVSSTYLAYQYFGHPALRLQRSADAATTRDPASVAGRAMTAVH